VTDSQAEQIRALQQKLDQLGDELTEARRALVQLKRESALNRREPAPAAAVAVPPERAWGSTAPDAAEPSPAPPPRKSAPPRQRPPDTERLIGRYGALALGALTVVMGIGALVSWAVANDLLGPKVRVGFGALVTATLAVVGWGVRDKNPRFGNTLLALSVGLLQIVAWGAGPALKLVPPTIALEVADLGSLLLVALALKESSESLFLVGFGASLLAPFVIRTGTERFLLLALYGLVLIVGALRAIRRQTWPRARALLVVATIVYATAATLHDDSSAWLNHSVGVILALTITIVSLLMRRDEESLGLTIAGTWTAVVLCAVAVELPFFPSAAARVQIAALTLHSIALLVTLLIAHKLKAQKPDAMWWAMVTLAPLMLLDHPFRFQPLTAAGTGLRVGLAAILAAAAVWENVARRAGLLAIGGFVSGWALYLAVPAELLPALLGVHAIAMAAAARATSVQSLLFPAGVSLYAGWFAAIIRLVDRGYAGRPFLTEESGTCAALTLAVFVVVHLGANEQQEIGGASVTRRSLATALGGIAAFFWGATEFALAIDHDTGTFLLVFYLAACGVALIGAGRRRRLTLLRQIGLALAVASALFALVSASSVAQIGFRVGSYLAVGAFLLGVAWWYRADVPEITSTAR